MTPELLAEFRRCGEDPAADEVRYATLVARTMDPALQEAELSQRLGALARSRAADETPWAHLRRLGFAGNAEDYAALDNSHLQRVLDSRRGLPITLGVLLIHQAREAGHRAAGVNFPGHFLVRVDEQLVDPFRMEPISEAECVERLPTEARQGAWSELFPEAPPRAVGLRMLNNLKLRYSSQAVWHEALDVVDAQVQLSPDEPALQLERGELWLRLGGVAPAREAFEAAVRLATGGSDAERRSSAHVQQVREVAQARLRDLRGASDVLH